MSNVFKLLLTAEDKTALLNIINTTTFKGADTIYVASLIDRIATAPLEALAGPSKVGSEETK